MNHIQYVVKTMLVSLVLLTTYTPSYASEYNATLCNHCSDMQMQAQAIASTPNGGNVHVIDFEGDRIKAFDVHSEWGLVTVMEKSVTPEVQGIVDELRETIQFLDNLKEGSIPLSSIQPYMQSPTVIPSAHVLAYTKAQKSAVAKGLAKYLEASVIATVKTAIAALGKSVVSGTIPVNLTYTVKFADGTTYKFVFKDLDVDGFTGKVTISIEPKHTFGLDGYAVIPDEADGYKGFSTAGSTDSLARILDYAKSRVTTIVYNGGATKTTTTIIDCTEGPNGEITCNAKK